MPRTRRVAHYMHQDIRHGSDAESTSRSHLESARPLEHATCLGRVAHYMHQGIRHGSDAEIDFEIRSRVISFTLSMPRAWGTRLIACIRAFDHGSDAEIDSEI
jgi:hypothetical protein